MRLQVLSLAILFLTIACSAPDKPLPDNEENRLSMAKVVLEAYPTQSYGESISRRITASTGAAVLEEAKAKVRQALTPSEIEKKRLELLVSNFTAEELKLMAELASTPTGRKLLEKIPDHEQGIIDFFVPFVMAALSNTDEQETPAADTL